MISEGQVGVQLLADGANQTFRMTKLAALVIQELHGRFYEQCYRGNMYSVGIVGTTMTALNSTYTASGTPIIGLWNPISSPVNLVILQATIIVTTIANTAVAPGGFMWAGSGGNTAVSTGVTPTNTKTLTASGSFAKGFTMTTLLTGLTNIPVNIRPCAISPMNAAGASPAVSLLQGNAVDNVDGSIVVPPGAFVGVFNTTSTTTLNLSSGLLWEEVPI